MADVPGDSLCYTGEYRCQQLTRRGTSCQAEHHTLFCHLYLKSSIRSLFEAKRMRRICLDLLKLTGFCSTMRMGDA
jgi:hypothetical protein